MKRILIITPRSPFQGRGADEQDRLEGIKWFVRNGFEVRVITKYLPNDLPYILESEKTLGIKITPVTYKFLGRKHWWKRIWNPLYWDGAAYEYFEPEIQSVVREEVRSFDPDIVWFDYTYLWPLYALVGYAKIITRSINYEPEHFLDEDGHSIINSIRAIPKKLSERLSLKKSNYFFSITPKEEKIYNSLGHTPAATLPLRALPSRTSLNLSPRGDGLTHIGFMSSTYTVSHNIKALLFIVDEVLPRLSPEVRSKISVHVTGNKLPKEVSDRLPQDVIYEGFVPSATDFWLSMDIALAPSILGAGMQQKIFEPLTIGLPTITSRRGIAGYPFLDGESVLCADSAEDFARSLQKLILDTDLRLRIGNKSKSVSEQIFTQEAIDKIIKKALSTI